MVSYEEACEILGREAHERAAAFSIELVATSSAVGRVVATDVVLFDADLTKVAQVETVDSTISDISTNDLQSEQAVLDREEVIEPEPSIETIESPQMREINRPNIFVRKGESF
jgi:hypothetical protein